MRGGGGGGSNAASDLTGAHPLGREPHLQSTSMTKNAQHYRGLTPWALHCPPARSPPPLAPRRRRPAGHSDQTCRLTAAAVGRGGGGAEFGFRRVATASSTLTDNVLCRGAGAVPARQTNYRPAGAKSRRSSLPAPAACHPESARRLKAIVASGASRRHCRPIPTGRSLERALHLPARRLPMHHTRPWHSLPGTARFDKKPKLSGCARCWLLGPAGMATADPPPAASSASARMAQGRGPNFILSARGTGCQYPSHVGMRC